MPRKSTWTSDSFDIDQLSARKSKTKAQKDSQARASNAYWEELERERTISWELHCERRDQLVRELGAQAQDPVEGPETAQETTRETPPGERD